MHLSLRSLPLAATVTLGAAVLGCATNPVTGKKQLTMMTEAQEIEMGRQADQEIRRDMPIYQDEALQRYVSDIGLRLARASHRPNLPWTFTVVDVPAVNAFALPGGFVYITRGILPYLSSEADLAGVLGHEIGHVAARHTVQQYSKAAGGQLGLLALGIFVPGTQPFSGLANTGLQLFFLKYGRADELEADGLGVEYAAREEWDPNGVGRMLQTLARLEDVTDRRGIPNWLSTHPDPEQRVTQVAQKIETAAKGRTGWVVKHDEYLDRLDGIVFGDDPEEGIVRDNLFLHPSMRLSIAFPLDWPISNGQEQVVAKHPAAAQYVVLQMLTRTQGSSIADVAKQHARQAGLRQTQGRETDINGEPAYVGTYEGRMKPIGTVRVRAAHVQVGRRVFFLAGVAKPDLFDEAAAAFDATIASVHELSAREASALRPNVVRLYTARAGDSWQSIAARQSHNIVRASTLAIMNGHPINEQPTAGERIKIVVEGT